MGICGYKRQRNSTYPGHAKRNMAMSSDKERRRRRGKEHWGKNQVIKGHL
jgi:hypothetical protein